MRFGGVSADAFRAAIPEQFDDSAITAFPRIQAEQGIDLLFEKPVPAKPSHGRTVAFGAIEAACFNRR